MAVTISYHMVLFVIKEIRTMIMTFGALVAQQKDHSYWAISQVYSFMSVLH